MFLTAALGRKQPSQTEWLSNFRYLMLPRESYEDRRITSLAFNVTGVDVTPDMGPLEVAHGTQWVARYAPNTCCTVFTCGST